MPQSFPNITLLILTAILSAPLLCYGDGSCSCRRDPRLTRLGTFSTFAEARAACRAARPNCIIDDCAPDCPCNFSCRSSANIVPVRVNGVVQQACDFRCTGGFGFCRASGRNDPHMRGFDGSRFNFQGVDGKTYAIFGRYDGELLVARMRATKKVTDTIRRTFFDAFGLKTEDGRQVEISMVNEHPEKRSGWKTIISVDGIPLQKSFEFAGLTISMSPDKKQASLKTRLAIYEIKAATNKGEGSQHLDVAIDLAGEAGQQGEYVGVLGFTLNKALDISIHESLIGKSSNREEAMRRRFETDGLFPVSLRDVDRMRGVARFVRRNTRVKEPNIVTAGVSHAEEDEL